MIPRAERRIHKPHGEWRSFRNAGDEECRFVDFITPVGFEAMFKEMAADPEAIAGEAATVLDSGCGVDVDHDTFERLFAAHGLSLPA